ncbi:hypothetical protein AB0K04_05720 [Micromonospora coxensis]|uniref:hypothetical protein n=1 Tax=Micromonospora coxensis TaxID=356852 RepID=UPI00341C1268
MTSRRWYRVMAATTVGVTVLALTPGVAQAALAPDQWHCTRAQGADVLCVKMNQFLGWWTGLDVRYQHYSSTGQQVRVQLGWESTRGQSGDFGTQTLNPNQEWTPGSWADLPTGTCVTGKALAVDLPFDPSNPGGLYTQTVCR